MGLVQDPSAPTPDSAAALEPPFIPVCPGCKYDLRGIPDGVCPECGESFSIAGLLAEAERRSRRVWSPHWLLLLCAFFVFPCLPASIHPSMTDDGVLFAWMLCIWLAFGWWAARARRLIFGERIALQLLLLYPIALGVCVFLLSRPSAPSYGAWIVSVGGTLFLAATWWSVHPRRLWIPVLWFATHLLSFGGMLVLPWLARSLGALHRTTLVDPRIGQVHRQYGLNVDEALAFGMGPLLVGVASLAAAMILLKRSTVAGRIGASAPSAK